MQSRGDTKRRGNAPRTEVIATAQALAHDPVPAPREEIRILEVDHVVPGVTTPLARVTSMFSRARRLWSASADPQRGDQDPWEI